jgi:hypothetical protein
MSSVGEIKAILMNTLNFAQEGKGGIQQAINSIEAQIIAIQHAMEGSNDASAADAIGNLMQAKQYLEDARGIWMGTDSVIESLAVRL